MKADTVLRLEAIDALIAVLGEVDTERFISMIKRDTFDYTDWQSKLWGNKSIDEIHLLAKAYEDRDNYFAKKQYL